MDYDRLEKTAKAIQSGHRVVHMPSRIENRYAVTSVGDLNLVQYSAWRREEADFVAAFDRETTLELITKARKYDKLVERIRAHDDQAHQGAEWGS